MKALDIPKNGRCQERVFYRSRFGWCCRAHVVPRDPLTAARSRMREVLGAVSKVWGALLTEHQRQRWVAAAAKLGRDPRLGQSGPLSGQAHFVGINSARARIGRDLLREPPSQVVFRENPVAELILTRREGRLRFELKVCGPVKEDIMVLGAAPCNSGRRICRKPVFLGLLPSPVDGISDITKLYVERFGEPKVNQRVFIRLRQQRNGWEGPDKDLHCLVLPSLEAETQELGHRPERPSVRFHWDHRRIPERCPRDWLPGSRPVRLCRSCGDSRVARTRANWGLGTRTSPPKCQILSRTSLRRMKGFAGSMRLNRIVRCNL